MEKHVVEFIDVTRKGLGNFSEVWQQKTKSTCDKCKDLVGLLKIHISFSFQQEFEALHSDFKPTWQRFKRGMENENYDRKFLRAVVVYNSEHLK